MTPIRDYAIIGNCETAALINPRGGIDWLCLPTFDAGSFFGALLDEEKGGSFTIAPKGDFRVEREYLEDSAILQTRFISAQGTVKLTDFFVIARKSNARFYDFTSLHPTRKLVRLVELEEGAAVEMEIRIEARPDYARAVPSWRAESGGGFVSKEAALYTNAVVRPNDGVLSGQAIVTQEEPLFAVLDYAREHRMPDLKAIREWLRVTTAFWHEWNLFNYYRGPHCKLVRRSAVTLKLLTYAETGGFVAAPTTSLPEGLSGEANWDYRFCWVRDTALFIQTLFGLGYSGEAKAFIDFVVEKWVKKNKQAGADSSKPTVEVMFPVCTAPIPPETELNHLAGYGGAQPARLGNRAQEQFQLDNYGHLLQSLYYFMHTGGKIDRPKREMISKLTAEAMAFWREGDNGIWEGPETLQYTYGKVMCWAALQRARDLNGDKDGAIEKTCGEIRDEIMRRGIVTEAEQKIFSAQFDEGEIDASSLLAFTSGFLPEYAAKPTREAIERELARGPFLRRNNQNKKEGAFLLCSFWWIDHLIREGHLKRAEELLARVIEKVSPLGLLSEEIDPETGEFLGNFPQAFSHLGLIQSVLNLESAKRRTGFYGLADHEKFTRSVGATIGWKGVVAGFFRVPRTVTLFLSRKSKWRESSD